MKEEETEQNTENKPIPELTPTIGNLDNIQKSFDKARKEISQQKNINKDDFRSV